MPLVLPVARRVPSGESASARTKPPPPSKTWSCSPVCRVPDPRRPVVGRSRDPRSARVEERPRHPLAMTPQHDELLAGLRVPDPRGVVQAARDDARSVTAELGARHAAAVPGQDEQLLACPRVPDARGSVARSGEDALLVGAEDRGGNPVLVPAERHEPASRGGIRDARGRVAARRQQPPAVPAEGDARDPATVRHGRRDHVRERERAPEHVFGLRGPLLVDRLPGEQDAQLRVGLELARRRRRELSRPGRVRVVDRVVSLDPREDGEDHGDRERDPDRGDRDPLPSALRAPARERVLALELCRLGLGLRRDARKPVLCFAQVGAAEQQALVVVPQLPLARADKQSRVRADPVEVGLERLDERVDGVVEVVLGAEEDPVPRGELGRDGEAVRIAIEERDDSLPVLERVRQLLAALLGAQRVRADHERERVRGVDPRRDLAAPFGRRRDVLPVGPDLLVARRKRLAEPPGEVGVLPRVGEEDVGLLRTRRRLAGRCVRRLRRAHPAESASSRRCRCRSPSPPCPSFFLSASSAATFKRYVSTFAWISSSTRSANAGYAAACVEPFAL